MEGSGPQFTPKIFVICNRSDTAPLWGYILRQEGLIAILETRVEKAIDRWSAEMAELIVIDIDSQDYLALCKRFRSISVAPILLLLPVYHETQILEAYANGVNDVVIKPLSPTIFLAKILAWLRYTRALPTSRLNVEEAGTYRLIPVLRCLVGPKNVKIKLTNLEFRLLQLLMSSPGDAFMVQEQIECMWGGYENGDHVLLKNVVYRLRKKN